jgi:predicted nucleic acid-binding protein
MAIITQDELLQYLYKETSAEKTAYIMQELSTDAALKERFDVIAAAKERLEKLKLLTPDNRSLERIFQHSEKEMKAFS